MGRNSDSVLSTRMYRKFLMWLQREKLVCERCGVELHPGDLIHRCGSVFATNTQWGAREPNKSCRFYHEECFQSLYIEL